MTIDDVEDIEVLRKAAKVLEAENLVMSKMIVKLKRELFEMKHGKPEQLMLQIAELEDQLARRNKMLFGEKSEKTKGQKKSETDKTKQTGHGRREQPALEEVEQVHVANLESERCNLCGGALNASEGFVEQSEEIDIIERKFVIKKHVRQKYKCGCGSCIKTAPGPLKLFDGARYSINFALHVAINKYADHAPLERQVRGMKRDGLVVDSQTLWDQIQALATHLQPAYDRLKSYVLCQPVIGVDETHWKLMGEKGKKQGGKGKRWQAWAICCPDAVHYSFEGSRSAETAKQVLGDYAGIVLTDGYAAYDSLKKHGGKFKQANCWAHVRRKFLEVEEQHPGKCKTVLDLIGQLYDVERQARGKPPDEVLALRREHSKPILLAIQNWALGAEALPESNLGKAIAYMAKLWNGLRLFVDHPEVDTSAPWHSDRKEKSLRLTLGARHRSRRTFLHSDRERQARRSRSTHVFACGDQRCAAWRRNPAAARNALSATATRSILSVIQDGCGRVGTTIFGPSARNQPLHARTHLSVNTVNNGDTIHDSKARIFNSGAENALKN